MPHRTLLRATTDEPPPPNEEGFDLDSHVKESKDLDDLAQQLLSSNPAKLAAIQKFQESAATVADLIRRKEVLEQEYALAIAAEEADRAAQERRQAQAAAERGSDADLSAALAGVEAARSQLAEAEAAAGAAAAERLKDADRLESGKAAAAGAVGGLLCALPVVGTSGQLTAAPLLAVADIGSQVISAALFGVVFRYAVRSDTSNKDLKGGVIAGFGLVRAFALGTTLLEGAADPLSADTLGAVAISAGLSVLLFGFAAAALELALRQGIMAPKSE